MLETIDGTAQAELEALRADLFDAFETHDTQLRYTHQTGLFGNS